MVFVALIVLLAEACQCFWSKATAAPVMLVILPGDVHWCSWHRSCCSRRLASESTTRLESHRR
jgi:hypothetical protein